MPPRKSIAAAGSTEEKNEPIRKSADPTFARHDHVALKRKRAIEAAETAKSIRVTGGLTLTPEEYKNAHPAFKILVETPIENKEPVYILPEFDARGQLHPELAKLIKNIKECPDYMFIKETYGEFAPKLLRLFYGLSNGYKISREQFRSMMMISYVQMAGMGEVKSMPFYFYHPVGPGPTVAAGHLYGGAWKFRGKNENEENSRRADLLLSLCDKDIPEAERSIGVVKLNNDYLGVVLHSLNFIVEHNPKDQIIHGVRDEILAIFKKKHIKFDKHKTEIFIREQGIALLQAILHTRESHFRVFIIDGECCFLFPAQTIIKKYVSGLNPGNPTVLVDRAGPISSSVFESHVARNERPGTVVLGGITNDTYLHQTLVSALAAVLHDDYHYLLVVLMEPVVYSQMYAVYQVLRDLFPKEKGMTSEIMRALDREKPSTRSPEDKLYYLIEHIFSIDKESPKHGISKAGIVLLLDMMCSPELWPFYAPMKERFFNLFLPAPKGTQMHQHIAQVESVAKKYLQLTSGNIGFTAILMICHLELKDERLSETLASETSYNTLKFRPVYAWLKKPHGYLYPVLVFDNVEYTFEKLGEMPPKRRMELCKKSIRETVNDIYDPESFKPSRSSVQVAVGLVTVGLFRIKRVGEEMTIEALEEKAEALGDIPVIEGLSC